MQVHAFPEVRHAGTANAPQSTFDQTRHEEWGQLYPFSHTLFPFLGPFWCQPTD